MAIADALDAKPHAKEILLGSRAWYWLFHETRKPVGDGPICYVFGVRASFGGCGIEVID